LGLVPAIDFESKDHFLEFKFAGCFDVIFGRTPMESGIERRSEMGFPPWNKHEKVTGSKKGVSTIK
jgi:hypothetical protein